MRYARQKKLVDQKKLSGSTAAVVGLGGLGNPAATYLALAGVNLVLIDNDVVEESNLNRQFLFTEKDVGKKKIEAAARRLKEMNPGISIRTFREFSRKALEGVDVTLDCLDNWESRERLWDAACPVIHGGAGEFFGQVAVFMNRGDSEPFRNKKGKQGQIVGAAAGVVGSRMAMEAIKLLSGRGGKKLLTLGQPLSYDCIIIRFSEIWLKSPVTRRKMIGIFKDNVSRAIGQEVGFEDARLVTAYSPRAVSGLARVFGVKSFSPVFKFRLSELSEGVRKLSRKILSPGKSFKIDARRTVKVGKTSMELQKELGAIAAGTGARVDLSSPDITIGVEVHKDHAYVFLERIPGPGGMPLGVEGRALALFSGGIDSPVAAWMVARRGASVEALFLNPLGPALESKVSAVFKALEEWMPGSKLHVIDVSKEMDEIRGCVREGFRQTVYKRFIYRVAEELAKQRGGLFVVTGESLGQVSSQTLQSLHVIEGASGIPVLRPLIGMDKEEITRLARKIGTYGASSSIPEFCSMESHSNASPRIGDVLREERKLDFDYPGIAARIREASRTGIDLSPPGGRKLTVVRVWEGVPELQKNKEYLFVCKSGNVADEEALKAREMGFTAFSLSHRKARKKGLI